MLEAVCTAWWIMIRVVYIASLLFIRISEHMAKPFLSSSECTRSSARRKNVETQKSEKNHTMHSDHDVHHLKK